MAKDYYKILGVDKNFDEAQLKKAFRKKSIEWHPDKWQDKSEAEKKNAEEQFKLVAEAYACLKDPEKRARYDQYGDDWDQMNGANGGMSPDIEEILKRMHGGFFDDFFGGGFHEEHQGPQPGQTIRVQYPISIEEIFNGVTKEIEVPVYVRCKECNGTGGEVKTCSHCHGQGVFVQTQHTPFGIIQNQSVCPYCHGKGKEIVKKCKKCNGTGEETLKRRIKLNISPFTQNGTNKRYTAMGYESKDPNGVNGDLIVQIIYNVDSSKYVIQGNTVYEKIKVPYYTAILGGKIKTTLPNHKEETLEIKPLSQEGDQVTLLNRGINGGNYIFIISLDVPKNSILDKEKKLLEDIKNLHK